MPLHAGRRRNVAVAAAWRDGGQQDPDVLPVVAPELAESARSTDWPSAAAGRRRPRAVPETRLKKAMTCCLSWVSLSEWRGADPGLANSLPRRRDPPPELPTRLSILADSDLEGCWSVAYAEGAAVLAVGGAAAPLLAESWLSETSTRAAVVSNHLLSGLTLL